VTHSTDTPAATVIVPVHNGGASLTRLLDTLHTQELDRTFEVVVVDNASTDATTRIAMEHPLRPQVVFESRRGSYAARNAGVRVARGAVLAFTDVDCAPERTWLAAGIAGIEEGADLVGGDVEQQMSEKPTRWERFDARHYLNQRRYVEKMRFAATANLFVRREVIDRTGPFDAALLSSGDLEFCYRAQRNGYRLAFRPDAVVRHAPRRTIRQLWSLHTRLAAGKTVLRHRHPNVIEELEARRDNGRVEPKAPEPVLAVLRRRWTLLAPFLLRSLAGRVGDRRGRQALAEQG
jgi:glycosyltransferase involved in cell wall biosynthesis